MILDLDDKYINMDEPLPHFDCNLSNDNLIAISDKP